MSTAQAIFKPPNNQTMEEESTVKPTIGDALQFVKSVKEVFLLHLNKGGNYSKKYDQFASALDQFYNHRFTSEELVATIEPLLEGCGSINLTSGFENFLPKNQETKRTIRLVCKSKKYSGFERRRQACHEFLDKIKTRERSSSGNNNISPGVYKSILEIMIKYGTGKFDIAQVSEKVITLLIGHADLVYEFERFFADRDEKTRKEVEKIRVCTIDDYLDEMEVLLSNLRSSIRRLEETLNLFKPDSSAELKYSSEESKDHPLRGLSRFVCFKNFFEKFGLEKIEALKGSCKEEFPDVLIRLKQKEFEVLKYRSKALDFLLEIRQLHCISKKRKARQMFDRDSWDLGLKVD